MRTFLPLLAASRATTGPTSSPTRSIRSCSRRALKENGPVLHGGAERSFANPPPDGVAIFKAADGDHGRLEERVHRVCHDVARPISERRFLDEPAFSRLSMIGMVESRTERRQGEQ